MTWWQLSPIVLCAAVIVFLPGYALGRCWGLRGLVAAGAAAPVSVGVTAGMAVLCPVLGLRWSVWPVLAASVLAALGGLAVRRFAPAAFGSRPAAPLRARWTLVVHAGAVLIPAVLLTRGLVRLIGGPDNISQAWDNLFHLNAIRSVLDTGSGSSLTLGELGASDRVHPYPAAWHDLVSLVVQVTGTSIPAAVTAVTIVVAALVWPVSCIFLTTRVTGTRPVPVLLAGGLAAVFGAFPYQLLYFGPLYPFFLAVALLPAVLALVAMAAGVGARHGTPRWLLVLTLVPAAAGLALAHPSEFLALAVFSVPVLVVAIIRYRRHATGARRWIPVALLAGYLAAGAVVWAEVRPSADGSHWQPVQTLSQAIGEVLTVGTMKLGPTWVVLALTVVAAGLALRRQVSWWVLGGYLIAAALYVATSAGKPGRVRSFLAGIWYDDPHRLAAQLPVFAVVLCTIAAAWSCTRLRAAMTLRFPDRARLSAPLVAVLAFVVAAGIGVAGQRSSVNSAIGTGGNVFQRSDMLSPDERALLARLDRTVPIGDTVIGNPWSGASFSYALADRRALILQYGTKVPAKTQFVLDHLPELRTDPAVCAAVRAQRSWFVLDFGGPQYLGMNAHYRAIDTAAVNSGLTVVDHQGAATLYLVTGCRSGR
ncbi:DUF6541 family protein [Labedaea rhizosphaerae]|uniref:Uncharacterized protein n=1 Tax=Labedaea rhizosphaerae TaxID=598644 RepID=A0A4R6S6M6_LABRH|nr:DUF6541 family protein [Labedaea rhizosphaerae]TDP94847.1 hypothetical protein EV186_10579 [Labedaea rhizosphaerae]